MSKNDNMWMDLSNISKQRKPQAIKSPKENMKASEQQLSSDAMAILLGGLTGAAQSYGQAAGTDKLTIEEIERMQKAMNIPMKVKPPISKQTLNLSADELLIDGDIKNYDVEIFEDHIKLRKKKAKEYTDEEIEEIIDIL